MGLRERILQIPIKRAIEAEVAGTILGYMAYQGYPTTALGLMAANLTLTNLCNTIDRVSAKIRQK